MKDLRTRVEELVEAGDIDGLLVLIALEKADAWAKGNDAPPTPIAPTIIRNPEEES